MRYLGIDTPEKNEPFANKAKARNRGLVQGKDVRLVIDTGTTRHFDGVGTSRNRTVQYGDFLLERVEPLVQGRHHEVLLLQFQQLCEVWMHC